MKKAKITAEGNFNSLLSKHHSFVHVEVFLVLLIINLMWGERRDKEASKRVKMRFHGKMGT